MSPGANRTYLALLGLKGAKDHLSTLLSSALETLRDFGPEPDALRPMSDYVVARTH